MFSSLTMATNAIPGIIIFMLKRNDFFQVQYAPPLFLVFLGTASFLCNKPKAIDSIVLSSNVIGYTTNQIKYIISKKVSKKDNFHTNGII
jgi:hypothetical protein